MSGPDKILVVDDADAGRFVKVQTLRRAGYDVIESGTGSDGIAKTAAEHPDLIVLDVNLPDISGLEVCRRLRVAEDAPIGLQILQISNTAVTPADQVRGLDHGADVYLVEPVESSVLLATVRALLRVRKAELAMAVALDGERAARQIAEHASRLKDEFIATLSHELRTPLNALMGWIWQLRHISLDEDARGRALDSIERNARMQAQLINDLLDVSRASKGKLQLEMRIVDLKTVVQAAAEFIGDSVERKHLDIQFDLASVWVAGDEARLQQIAANLLTNAIQFTPANGRVSVSLAAHGDSAVLTVKDTGAGIDAAFLPYVFDQFRQGEGGLSRKHGGLGLGLTVVKQLIDLHGGAVEVASGGAGQGTTFIVKLPREQVDAPPDRAARARLLLQDVKVTIVGGNDGAELLLRSALESSGARVSPAATHAAGSDVGIDADLVIDANRDGTMTVRVPGTPEPLAAGFSAATPPSEIVRGVARAVATTRARSRAS